MPDFTAADGARLHYTDEGHGVPLLCLAGLTRDGRDFDYLAPHLPPLRLIRPDYRGRGQSEWTGAATYTVAQEAGDALALLDHLRLNSAVVLGTSRGGIIGMYLAATARERLRGLCLNDVGPVVEGAGLARIAEYIGVNPAARSHAAAAVALEHRMTGFANVPKGRWMAEARKHFNATDNGLELTYDPALRNAYLAAMTGGANGGATNGASANGASANGASANGGGAADMWPLFDACADLPLALIRGANSNLLSRETADEMQRRRPDMIFEEVPDRGHIPFLDEPESLRAIHQLLGRCL